MFKRQDLAASVRRAPNDFLNYGYTLLRAATARALMASGLLPSLRIVHRNYYDAIPLADDIMEPYRPFIDQIVYRLHHDKKKKLDKEVKRHSWICSTQAFPSANRW